VTERRLRYWRSEFGLDREPRDEDRVAIPQLARR
jgi:hypothetical protein